MREGRRKVVGAGVVAALVLSPLGIAAPAARAATDPPTGTVADRTAGPAPVATAAAAVTDGCGYGQGGQHAGTVCWLDMSGYDDTLARTPAGQNLTVHLPGGYTLGYNVRTSTVPGRLGPAIAAVTTPIEKQANGDSRFAFGSEAYRGIPGRPSLYSAASGGTTGLDVTLSGIALTDPSGTPITSYSFVATDTEDNIAGESLRWTSDKPLNLLETLYPQGTKGCQPAGISGLGTTTVSCNGTGAASTLASKSTSILVAADAPSTFALRWQTPARSGIAFGIETATIQVTKNVDGRSDRTDSFDVGLTSAEGTTLASATTGSAVTATTGPVPVIPPASGDPFTLTDSVTPGSGASMADYDRSWSCTRNGQADASLPSGDQASIRVSPAARDAIACTVTNRAKGFDGGDAPASYGTALTDRGPRHSIPDYDRTDHTASLMLGRHVDVELDGAVSAGADGDDRDSLDDEDGLTGFSMAPGASTASAAVSVVNTTGSNATLYGWVDANADGAFQSTELAKANVPPSSGPSTVTLSWTGLTPASDDVRPVVRLRLTTASLVDDLATPELDERALGAAPDGEVEDSRVLVGTPAPTTCANPAVETFGTGPGYGPALPPGQTTYRYVSSGQVQDGSYAIMSHLPGTAGSWWVDTDDHTVGDTDGRMMVVNASFDPGTFFRRTFTGLTAGNPYEFSAWVGSADAGARTIPANVTLRVVDAETGAVVAEAGTGDLVSGDTMTWKRFGTSFVPPGAAVRLEMVNNAPGGDGNDLVIDDIGLGVGCDYGDAPDSFRTTSAANGPSARIIRGLSLGAAPDPDPDGRPGSGADGDDRAGADDEDGVNAPIVQAAGQPTSVQVTATNDTASDATLAGWIDLDGSGTFTSSELRTLFVTARSGTQTYTLTFPAPSVLAPTYARFRLATGRGGPFTQPTGPGAGGEVEDYPVLVATPALTVTKTSDAAATSSRPGDVVHYTVTLTNSGTADYTAANPARMVDDLSDVLDDATYADDASADQGDAPTYTAPRITWSGALAKGRSVTITYSVKLGGGGNGHVRNVAFAPPDGDPGSPVPDCATVATTVPCDATDAELPKLAVAKAASQATLPGVGDRLTYRVTLTNTGLGDFTADHPATVDDDLSQVLDDATLDAVPSGAVLDGDTLRWSGPLPAGESTTVTYTVTYRATGDHLLTNNACVPSVDVRDAADRCSATTTPGSGLRQAKTVDPASGTAVDPGQVLTYTLTFDNSGAAAATVDTTDDLTGVLDDADLVAGSIRAQDGLTADLDDPDHPAKLLLGGAVDPGQQLTVTYEVKVRAFADQDDHVLTNALMCEAGEPAPCLPTTTVNPVRRPSVAPVPTPTQEPARLTVHKAVQGSHRVVVGERIHYRIEVRNIGAGATNGPLTMRDRLPRGLALVTARGSGWRCAPTRHRRAVVCTTRALVPAGHVAPAVTVVATATASAAGKRLVNVATVRPAGQRATTARSNKAWVRVVRVPSLPETGYRLAAPVTSRWID